MKKFLLLSMAVTIAGGMYALEPENWDGVSILPNCYSAKITHDGSQITGETEDGGTFYFNRNTNEAYYYGECSFGRGYVISDNGWLVGTKMMDLENQTNTAVIMSKGEVFTPDVFKNMVTSNIHSITPDGSRICGVISTGQGASNYPFYCDVDADGNVGELHLLPTPPTDFFGAPAQYCSATWMSEDGKTIAGQVIVSSGFYTYPIIYKENEEGIWNYSYPSKSLFNPEGLEIPEEPKDFSEMYPGVVTPDPTNFMNEEELEKWEEALITWGIYNYADEYDPYLHLSDYLSKEAIQEYNEQMVMFEYYEEEYLNLWADYSFAINKIADTSVLFVRNAMALSADGKWLASSGEVPGTPDANEAVDMAYYYVPYLFNLETGENWRIGLDNMDLVTNQVLPNGNVICATPAAGVLPPSSYVYEYDKKVMTPIYDYVKSVNNIYGWWMDTYLTGEVQVSETGYQRATVTGLVAASEDLTTICGGVLASALDYDMIEFTYMMSGLPAGIEEIVSDTVNNNGVYNVFNLQGVKVMETKDASLLNNLSKGIYVINGKKVMIK